MAAKTTAPTRSNSQRENSKLTKADSMDYTDDAGGIQTLGEDSGLGRILLGLRYHPGNSSLEVRIVRGEGLRCEGDKAGNQGTKSGKPTTYCTVSFLPDRTEPVSTATVEASNCPRWRGAFFFEKFPTTTSQRCLQVQVMNAASRTAASEVTLLLGHWSLEEFERGVRVWKYLNSTQDTQRVSNKEGSAFLSLHYRQDRFKLTLHRLEDLNPRYTAASQPQEFHANLQALISGCLVKEATLRGLRKSPGTEVNFYDGEFGVRVGKHGSHNDPELLTLRMVVTRPAAGGQEDLYWLDLGSEVRRMDCRSLFQSVLENPGQSHLVSVHMNRPPVANVLEQDHQQQQSTKQHKHPDQQSQHQHHQPNKQQRQPEQQKQPEQQNQQHHQDNYESKQQKNPVLQKQQSKKRPPLQRQPTKHDEA